MDRSAPDSGEPIDLEQPPEDVLAQRLEVSPSPPGSGEVELPLDADPADVVEQITEVRAEGDTDGWR
jgi:hypothetical protein